MLPEACMFLLPFSPAFDADSCDSISQEFRDDPVPARSRALLSLSQTDGGSPVSIFRHESESDRWESRADLREDSLVHVRLGWRDQGWRISAGDVEDASMPMRPAWLAHRSNPQGIAPVLKVAMGYAAPGFRAYALRAWDEPRLPNSRSPESPVDFRHWTGGVEFSSPLHFSLHVLETRISENGTDSISEQRIALSLGTPKRTMEIDEAWNGSWENPEGQFALRLRIPLYRGASAQGEGWNVWGAGGSPHGAGMRGRFSWSDHGLHFEMRGSHSESWSSSGTLRTNCLLAWRAEMEKDLPRAGLRARLLPGIAAQTTGNGFWKGTFSLGIRIPLASGWALHGYGSRPLPLGGKAAPEVWRITLRYAEPSATNRPATASLHDL